VSGIQKGLTVKKKLTRILFLIVTIVLVLLPLTSCQKSNKVVSNKIIILEEEESGVTATGFGDALKSVLYAVLRQRLDRDLLLTQQRITVLCAKADEELHGSDITNAQYVALKQTFIDNKDDYVQTLLDILDGQIDDNFKKFLGDCLTIVGKQTFSSVLYTMVAENFYFTYNNNVKNEYTETVIKSSKQDYEDFKSIKKEDFENVLSLALVSIDFMGESIDDTATSFTFTDGEIASILKKAKFTNNINTTGWRVLIKTIGDLLNAKSFWGEIYKKVLDNTGKNNLDDLGHIAERVPMIIDLVLSIQQKMTAENIALAREGDKTAFLADCFDKFSEEEWDKLEEILTPPLAKNYLSVGLAYFGSDFTTYYQSLTKHTVSELKGCEEEDFSDIFEGIVGSISPTFSYYWWHYDRD